LIGYSASPGSAFCAAADNRLVEVQSLFDSSASLSQVPATIDDFTSQALEASALLLDEYEQTGDPALIEELRQFAADNLDALQGLAMTASPEHQDELALAADALMQIDQQATAACPTCAIELQSLTMPSLFVSTVEARDAMEAVQRVRLYNDHPVITEDKQPKRDGGDTKAPPDGDKDDDVTPPEDTEGTEGTEGTDNPESPDEPESPNGPVFPDLPTGGLEADGPDGDGYVPGNAGTESSKNVLPGDLDPLVETLLP
jgi:hypothetical protein